MYKSAAMDERKKVKIWDKWGSGHSMGEIARTINKPPATVFSYLRYHGGIQPHKRVRPALTLSLVEREEISRGLAAEHSIRSIAKSLDRSASTISREVQKNGGRKRYRALIADKRAWKLGKRPKRYRLASNMKLKTLVTGKLSKNWSPEQISGWLKLTFPSDVMGACMCLMRQYTKVYSFNPVACFARTCVII